MADVWLYHKRQGAKIFDDSQIKEMWKWGWRDSPGLAEKFRIPKKEDAVTLVDKLLASQKGFCIATWVEEMGFDTKKDRELAKEASKWYKEIEKELQNRKDVIKYNSKWYLKEVLDDNNG